MLEPVKSRSAVDAAIENIGKYISTLQVGDVLPGERDLALKLQISRNITREALQHFRTLGIIESRPKIGATVARLLPENPYAGYMPFLAVSRHSLKELVELRLILESGCCELAAANITAEELARLYDLASAINELKSDADQREAVWNMDIEFHSAFIRASRNSLLDSLIPLVVEFFSEMWRNSVPHSLRSTGYEEHLQMVDALKNKDAGKLRDLVVSHIKVYNIIVNKGEFVEQ